MRIGDNIALAWLHRPREKGRRCRSAARRRGKMRRLIIALFARRRVHRRRRVLHTITGAPVNTLRRRRCRCIIAANCGAGTSEHHTVIADCIIVPLTGLAAGIKPTFTVVRGGNGRRIRHSGAVRARRRLNIRRAQRSHKAGICGDELIVPGYHRAILRISTIQIYCRLLPAHFDQLTGIHSIITFRIEIAPVGSPPAPPP